MKRATPATRKRVRAKGRRKTEIPRPWQTISAALGAESREYPVVRGASGIEHRFLALAVDDPTRRLILISAEPDPRLVSLIQSDIQSTMPETRVLIARPSIIDLSVIAKHVVSVLGTDQMTVSELRQAFKDMGELPDEVRNAAISKIFEAGFERIAAAIKHVTIPIVGQIITVVQQSTNLDWDNIMTAFNEDTPGEQVISIAGLAGVDNLAIDRKYGVCPIPLYEFTESDWALLNTSDDLVAVRQRLSELGVYKYFFPPKDELAIGFVDRGISTVTTVEKAIERATELGHQLADATLIDSPVGVLNIVAALKEAGFFVEGEIGLDTGQPGKAFRAGVRFRPQEGLLEKVLNRLNLTVSGDLTSLLK